jgi:hypothetical protein
MVARDFQALPVTARLLAEHLRASRPRAPPAQPSPESATQAENQPPKITTSRKTETTMGRTLYDKIWDEHVVHTEEDGTSILYIDRHLVHEVTSPQAFEGLREAGRKVWRVSSIVATADHNTTTGWERAMTALPTRSARSRSPRWTATSEFGAAAFFPFMDKRQGIVHVIGPENGATLPGMTVVCGDSTPPPTAPSARWPTASAPPRSST